MKNFDDLFRDELADHAEMPPSRVWESLDKRLNAHAAGGKTPFGKGWYWYVGVASVAVLIGGLGWNMANKNAAPTAAPVAQAADMTPAMEEPATMPEQEATSNVRRNIAAVRRRTTGNGMEQVADKSDEVSPYGNAAATGTKLHSYDDFDERAVACGSQKPAPLNSDAEHAANGYKVHKIRKHRLVAAEMVPTHLQENVVAANTDAVKPIETGKPAVASRPAVRTMAGKVAGTHGPKKSVTLVNETSDAGNTNNENNTEATAQLTDATPAAATADKPASTSMPVPAGSATAARPKPASEVMVASKPTTGGTEIGKIPGKDSATQQEHAQNTEEGDGASKKGLWGIFKKKKK